MGVRLAVWFLRALRWGLRLFVLTFCAVALWSALWPARSAADFAAHDVIVVLGGGMDADGTLHSSTRLRVARGVDLFEAGAAPRLHMTGGMARDGGPSAGEGMRDLAMELGVPKAAITIETDSLSTLQNALFSQPMLNEAESAILVSEAFHLPRSRASFVWAGGPNDLSMAMSTRFRWDDRQPVWQALRMLLRETLAIWFNLVRAVLHGLGGLIGVDDGRRDAWLA